MIGSNPLVSEMLEVLRADLRQMVDRLEATSSAELHEMAMHHFGWNDTESSGKHVRPLLCLLCCSAAGGDWLRALPAATAIELVHNFSLIHDDIEDGSELRRHRPTVWKIWGTAQAINAGDALYALARLSGYRLSEIGHEAEAVLRIQTLIDETCLDLTRGQYLDLAFDASQASRLDRYLEMIQAKTGSLLSASSASGALSAGASEVRVGAYQSFGLHLGMAFQILDDVLGVWGDEGRTGKPVGSDLRSRKPSYPALYGLENDPGFADLWHDADASMRALLESLDNLEAKQAAYRIAGEQTSLAFESLELSDPLEPAATALRALADRLLVRES